MGLYILAGCISRDGVLSVRVFERLLFDVQFMVVGEWVWWRYGMTTFDEREKAFERKFALDQDLKFKAEARRNRKVAEWAAAQLGLGGGALDAYVKAVRRADLEEAGDDDVFRKVRQDFDEKGVKVSDTEIREKMSALLAEAVAEIESPTKS